MDKDDSVFLRHVLNAIRQINEYLNGINKDKFMQDKKTQDAVIRELTIIGEAVNNISEEFKNKHKSVDWPRITGLRNVVVHKYFGVDLDIVWGIWMKDIPELEKELKPLLN